MKQPIKLYSKLCKNSNSTVYLGTRSRNPILYQNNAIFKKRKPIFISGTKLKNYILKDPIVDWLNLHFKKKQNDKPNFNYKQKNNSFSNFIKNKGKEFESKLIDYIHNNKIPVKHISEFHNTFTVKQTIEMMKQGVPLIHSAPLLNTYNNTGGVADILIRSDYIHKLVNVSPLTQEEMNIPSPTLNTPYHYLVIDIKFSTLPLTVNGINLLNSNNIPAYKSQVWIYTQALGRIQGYTPRYAFLMGRRWTKPSRNEKCFQCDDRLGVVDFIGCDSNYINLTKKAVEWIRTVNREGDKWSVSPPSRRELYPNMSVVSDFWQKEKEEIAHNIGEISMLWYCGVKQREEAFKHGVTSWKDPNCDSDVLGITGVRKNIIDKMIKLNNQDVINITPRKIDTNIYSWRNVDDCEVYLDFETMADIFCSLDDLPRQQNTSMIFMIGVGYTINGNWFYTKFLANELSLNGEYKLMNDFIHFIKMLKCKKIFYWCAENNFWNQAVSRQNNRLNYELNMNKFKHCNLDKLFHCKTIDLCNFFKEVPIIVRGCFGFGLKNISKKMKEYNMIQIAFPNTCESGMDASIKAWNAYKIGTSLDVRKNILKEIEIYNRFDCKVLWEIITYLRNNH